MTDLERVHFVNVCMNQALVIIQDGSQDFQTELFRDERFILVARFFMGSINHAKQVNQQTELTVPDREAVVG